MDVTQVAKNIELGADGVWFSRTKSPVSYPDAGNEFCFGVEETSFWFLHRNRLLAEAVARFPPPGLFFDIGGGNGFVSLALQGAGLPVVLIEPGLQGAKNARRRGIEHVICSTLDDAGLADETMPAAGIFDVLEHMEDDLDFLGTILRKTAPGGRLYLTVPAFQGLWSQEDVDAGHYRRYTASSLGAVLRKAGFQVEYLTYFFRPLPLFVLLLRTIPYRLNLRRARAAVLERAEHRPPGGPFNYALQALLSRELRLLRSGRTMAFGSSCLAIARKAGGAAGTRRE
jgi:SAM-dependent methyltransferase